MTDKKRTITPTDIITAKHKMRANGIHSYTKVGIVRAMCGVVSIAVGIGTTPIPFTTAPLIMVGSWLLGYDSKIIMGIMSHKVKGLGLWLYANRNKTLLMRTIKARLHQWGG